MTYIIPSKATKQHLQDNKSDVTGTIYHSKNINLDKDGYIKLAEPTMTVFSTTDSADFANADAMFPSASEIYINSDEVFSGKIDLGTITNRSTDTTVPTPSVEEDVIYFNGEEVISDGASIYRHELSTTWTAISTTLNTSFPTCMAVWTAENSLAVGNNNKVKFVNTSWAVNGTVLTLPDEYQVSSLVSNGISLYIGTKSKSGGEAKMFIVSAIATSADSDYGVGTFEIFSLKAFGSSVVCINSLGQLLRFNGGGFDELASLPVYNTSYEWADSTNEYSTVANRAMTVDGDLIYINLFAILENKRYKLLPNFPSGIWCYDSKTRSFYHRYSLSFNRFQTIAGTNVTVDAGADTFTLTSGNLSNVVTGMPLMYSTSTTKIPELKLSTPYYIIKSSSTVFKLATSYTNALAGTAIDITDVGTTAQNFYAFLINDFGWTASSVYRNSMAVLNNSLFNSEFAGRFAMAGVLGQKQAINTDSSFGVT